MYPVLFIIQGVLDVATHNSEDNYLNLIGEVKSAIVWQSLLPNVCRSSGVGTQYMAIVMHAHFLLNTPWPLLQGKSSEDVRAGKNGEGQCVMAMTANFIKSKGKTV